MPNLTKDEVKGLNLAKVDQEMDTRMAEVKRITDGVESWDQIPTDREGADRLPQMMKELNLLGERRDEIMAARSDQEKFTALSEVLKHPEKVLNQPQGRKAPQDMTSALKSHPKWAELKAGNRNVSVELDAKAFGFKATLGEDAAQAAIDTDYPVRADRMPGIVDELFQTPNIASLIPQITTGVNAVEYITENWTDAAAETNEGAVAAEATSDWAVVTENVRKIAVGIKASAEVLNDEGLLRGLVQLRLQQDLLRREDSQLIAGDGTAPNLSGILDRAGLGNANYSLAAGTDAFVDAIFTASTAVRQAFLNPAVAVMNALSWETLRLAKDGQGQYLYGPGFGDFGIPRIWGLRIVTNENLANPTVATNIPVIVGDFANSAMIARNGTINLAVTDADASDFLADVLTFKATMREAFIVHRPAGFATVTVTV